MFGSLGIPELLLIFIVALIVFGPRKLPEIGKTLGKALNEFKKASDELKSTIEREVHVEEAKSLAPAPPTAETVARAEPAPLHADAAIEPPHEAQHEPLHAALHETTVEPVSTVPAHTPEAHPTE